MCCTPETNVICQLHLNKKCINIFFTIHIPLKKKLQWGITNMQQDRIYIYIFIYCFLGPHPRHMEVPRLGVKSELQLASLRHSHSNSNLHHNSWQCWIPKPLSKARDWTCILLDPSQICFCYATIGTPGYI